MKIQTLIFLFEKLFGKSFGKSSQKLFRKLFGKMFRKLFRGLAMVLGVPLLLAGWVTGILYLPFYLFFTLLIGLVFEPLRRYGVTLAAMIIATGSGTIAFLSYMFFDSLFFPELLYVAHLLDTSSGTLLFMTWYLMGTFFLFFTGKIDRWFFLRFKKD